MMKALVILVLLTSLQGGASSAIDSHTQDLLITKLTNVFLKLPDEQAAKLRVTLRLADLHAERGRRIAKDELEKGCVECSNGAADRQKALGYYKYALPQIAGEQKIGVLVQMGHLYEVLGNTNEAISFYQQTLRSREGQQDLSEAHFSLGEIYFKKRQYDLAKAQYLSALEAPLFKRRGLAEYRVAWCEYNRGALVAAIGRLEKILKSPALLNLGTEEIANKDTDFQGEVAKDYTVFVAHGGQLDLPMINKVYELSPPATRLENITYLAKELERLGQNQGAVAAWEMVISKTEKPVDRLEALIYLAGVELKNNNPSRVLLQIERAYRNDLSMGRCQNDLCRELQKRLQNIVFDWHRQEKTKPSESLQKAYVLYLGMVPGDLAALELAGQVALARKDLRQAGDWNQQLLQTALSSPQKNPEDIEKYLLQQIEIAELVQEPAGLLQAQENYLATSMKRSKANEIHYNLAQRLYDKKDFAAASQAFYNLAMSPQTPQPLALQAAEMAVDTLVLMKSDSLIEQWSGEFARRFQAQSARFNAIKQKSVLSQAANVTSAPNIPSAAAPGASATALMEAWNTLQRFEVGKATAAEQVTFYRNKIVLARKLKKYDELPSAVNSMLAIKGLGQEDERFAKENKVFVAELQLDFSTALATYRQLNGDHWLELGRLADLAATNSTPFYLNYLKGEIGTEIAQQICDRLLREKGQLAGDLKICVPHLAKDKNLFARIYLENYSHQPDLAAGLAFLQKYDLLNTPAGRILWREKTLRDANGVLTKLQKHQLDGRTSQVATSIKSRVNRLTDLEKAAAAGAASDDWYLQTIFLTDLQREYSRFYDELLALPTPIELTDDEKQQYLTLLSQQAAPYKAKADEIASKLSELWSQDRALEQMLADFHNASFRLQKILGPQLERIGKILPAAAEFYLVYKSSPAQQLPSLAALETARQQVRKDPTDKKALTQLLQLERARGDRPMVLYLESRLSKIDSGFESL